MQTFAKQTNRLSELLNFNTAIKSHDLQVTVVITNLQYHSD